MVEKSHGSGDAILSIELERWMVAFSGCVALKLVASAPAQRPSLGFHCTIAKIEKKMNFAVAQIAPMRNGYLFLFHCGQKEKPWKGCSTRGDSKYLEPSP